MLLLEQAEKNLKINDKIMIYMEKRKLLSTLIKIKFLKSRIKIKNGYSDEYRCKINKCVEKQINDLYQNEA